MFKKTAKYFVHILRYRHYRKVRAKYLARRLHNSVTRFIDNKGEVHRLSCPVPDGSAFFDTDAFHAALKNGMNDGENIQEIWLEDKINDLEYGRLPARPTSEAMVDSAAEKAVNDAKKKVKKAKLQAAQYAVIFLVMQGRIERSDPIPPCITENEVLTANWQYWQTYGDDRPLKYSVSVIGGA